MSPIGKGTGAIKADIAKLTQEIREGFKGLNRMVLARSLAAALAISVLGCAASSVVMLDSRKFEPSDSVEILFEEPQDRKFEVIAIVEGNGSIYNTYPEVLKKAKEKAQQIGAHAIIPLPQENHYVPYTSHMIGQTPITMPGGNKITVKTIAIRYLDRP